ncbi:MAG: hypothetical protein ACD_46C00034G0002 [uncultured bacterium]|nr:MAG: hypothetical protein ACD_46C00034G0002 [uncultured bacterium]
MKWLRILFSLVLLLIIVAAVAIGGLMYFVDPNKLRPMIVERVMQQTGYQLAIYGKLSWSFYPNIGIQVERMTLAAPSQPDPFLDLRGVTIASKFSELIRGNKELKGDLRIADVRFANMRAQNASVELHWQNNVLTMEPITASLYQGSLRGVAHGTNLMDIPHWDWSVALDNVALQPLLKDANRGETKLTITGIGQVKVAGNTKGTSREQIINNFNGVSVFNLQNGSVSGLDLNYLVQTADAFINRQEVSQPKNIDRTDFSSLTGSVDIKDGVASTNNLLLNSSSFVTRGQGNFHLLEQSIDLSLQVEPQQNIKTKWEIPVIISGDIRHPDVKVDTLELRKYVMREELGKVKEKVQDEIKKVPGKAGEILQNLLGN